MNVQFRFDVQFEVIRLESSNLAENNRAVIIEGFPCHEDQLNTFNQCVSNFIFLFRFQRIIY